MPVNIIRVDGSSEVREFTYAPTLKDLQGMVGGYIELVYLKSGSQMIVDEEGLFKNKEVNQRATAVAGRMIVGDAVVLSGSHRMT